MKTKIIPFDLETAKKIQAGEIEGKIVCNKHQAEIISYEISYNGEVYLCVKWINNIGECIASLFYQDGKNAEAPELSHKLVLEVPDNEPQFKPFDKVLVREQSTDEWKCDYFSHAQNDGVCTYYVCIGGEFLKCIPYEGHEHLVGTTNKPKED